MSSLLRISSSRSQTGASSDRLSPPAVIRWSSTPRQAPGGPRSYIATYASVTTASPVASRRSSPSRARSLVRTARSPPRTATPPTPPCPSSPPRPGCCWLASSTPWLIRARISWRARATIGPSPSARRASGPRDSTRGIGLRAMIVRTGRADTDRPGEAPRRRNLRAKHHSIRARSAHENSTLPFNNQARAPLTGART